LVYTNLSNKKWKYRGKRANIKGKAGLFSGKYFKQILLLVVQIDRYGTTKYNQQTLNISRSGQEFL